MHPKNWRESETEEGILYTLNSDAKRTCLVKYDMTIEIRANNIISNYPAVKQLKSGSELRSVLKEIEKAKFCIGTQEGRDCKSVLFPTPITTNTLTRRCLACRKGRIAENGRNYKQRRRLVVSHESAAERACIVKNCPGRDSGAIKLYAIPELDKEAWCHNLKLNVSDLNDNMRVCSRHFKDECKNARTLKSGARPTLHLEQDDEVIDNAKLLKRRHIRICSIVGCNTTFPPQAMHCFPRDSERLKEWLLICVIKPETVGHKHKYICNQHFEKSMFCKNNKLRPDAVPKMDAVSWLEINANKKVDVLKVANATAVRRTQTWRKSKLAPEVHAINEIQNALIAKMEMEDEINSINKSDSFEGLQCENACLTCAKAFKDCETYRRACYELEKQLQQLQSKTDQLKEQNEILMSELESNYVVYEEEVEIELANN